MTLHVKKSLNSKNSYMISAGKGGWNRPASTGAGSSLLDNPRDANFRKELKEIQEVMKSTKVETDASN